MTSHPGRLGIRAGRALILARMSSDSVILCILVPLKLISLAAPLSRLGRKFITTKNPRSHHKGATGTGDQRLPVPAPYFCDELTTGLASGNGPGVLLFVQVCRDHRITGSGSISPVPRKLRLIIILKEGFCRIYRFFVPESTLTNKPLLGAPVSGC